jgi:hypothetical protein
LPPVYILLGNEKVTIFDRAKYTITQKYAGYLSIKRYLSSPTICRFNDILSVVVEEIDAGESLFYSIALRLTTGKFVPLSVAKYSGYEDAAKENAQTILLFIGLPIERIEEVKRREVEYLRG